MTLTLEKDDPMADATPRSDDPRPTPGRAGPRAAGRPSFRIDVPVEQVAAHEPAHGSLVERTAAEALDSLGDGPGAGSSEAVRGWSRARRRLLDLLARQGELPLEAIGTALGVTRSGARQVLAPFVENGWVQGRPERRPAVGRPRTLYALTETGRGLLPTRSVPFAAELLATLAEEVLHVDVLVEAMGRPLAEALHRHEGTEGGLPAALTDLGSGFRAQQESAGVQFLHVARCPLLDLAQHLPLVCAAEWRAFEQAFP